jgi:formate/nitrite transporter FocA (FNT family)
LAGSLFFGAIFIRYSGLASGPVETFITNTAATRGSLEWHQVFLRGIGCNIMVCLAVFVAQMSSDLVGKVFGIYFVLSAFGESLRGFQLGERGGLELTCDTPCIVVSQFEHVVADMFVIPLGMMLNKSPSVAVYIWK